MTVQVTADGMIELSGICAIEDAGQLQQYLLDAPGAAVDWRSCAQIHTAVIQILLASKPALRGTPVDDFLKVHLDPLLRAGAAVK